MKKGEEVLVVEEEAAEEFQGPWNGKTELIVFISFRMQMRRIAINLTNWRSTHFDEDCWEGWKKG